MLNADKIRAAVRAYRALNEDEQASFWIAVEVGGGHKLFDAATAPAAKPKKRRGPDKRGHYKCGKCTKVLPTKRGRAIHEASHETLDTTQLPLTGVK